MNISLSKTEFLESLRCPKILWLKYHKPSMATPIDSQTIHLFEVGYLVGQYARELFPGGFLIEKNGQHSFSELVAETIDVMNTKTPYLFEPAFAIENMLCRADVVKNNFANKTWDLTEVKMCTKIKPEHRYDLAFQGYCIEKSGYPLSGMYLMHVNNQYVRHGDFEPENFFIAEEITKDVRSVIPNIPKMVNNLLKIIAHSEPPHLSIGSNCSKPGKCIFYNYCHKDIFPGSIHELPYGARLIPVLKEIGIKRLQDIPDDFELSERQRLMVKSAKTKSPVVNENKIGAFLKNLEYPLYYLDFETVNPCVPLFEKSSPYEVVPFQYSLHIQQIQGGELQHHQFLPHDINDPRRALLEDLVSHIGRQGSLIAWNMNYEKNVLLNQALKFPEFKIIFDAWQSRFHDLIIPFRIGAYADHRFLGSASLKKVLPILCPKLSYENLAIQHGDDASLRYQLFIEGNISELEWRRMRPDMLAYCERDTYAMVVILDELFKIIQNHSLKGRTL
jgi:Domain of unknown function(DUF2779)/Domain of unknown function DUF83